MPLVVPPLAQPLFHPFWNRADPGQGRRFSRMFRFVGLARNHASEITTMSPGVGR